MVKAIILFLFVSCCVLGQKLFANDTTATVAAGGIQFTKSDDISMDEEVLEISLEKISISYKFTNNSDKSIETKVAFPLPPSPYGKGPDDIWRVFSIWDETYHAYKLLEDNPGDKEPEGFSNSNLKSRLEAAPFLNFERTINGEKYGYNYRVIAITPQGKDITSLLKKNNIPLSALYLIGYEQEGELSKNKKMVEKLKELQLLDRKGKPVWKNQTIYFWTQLFLPRKTISATHSYRPAIGHHWLMAKEPKSIDDIKIEARDLEKKDWKNYNPDEKTKSELVKLFAHKDKENPVHRAYEVQYILTTAKNWSGPIKKFRLEITPPNSDTLVVFSWPRKVEKKDGKYIAEVENFTPSQDLKILFIDMKKPF